MSHEDLDKHIGLPKDAVIQAMHTIEASQDELVDAVIAWRNFPVAKRFVDIFNQLEDTQDTIVEGLRPVFESTYHNNESYEDKQIAAATIVVGLRDTRTYSFKQILPDAMLPSSYGTPQELVSTMQREIEDEVLDEEDERELEGESSALSLADPGDVIGRLTSTYAQDFSQDIAHLTDAVRASPKGRLFDGANTLGHHALDVGKTSASLIIAGVVLSKILKRTS